MRRLVANNHGCAVVLISSAASPGLISRAKLSTGNSIVIIDGAEAENEITSDAWDLLRASAAKLNANRAVRPEPRAHRATGRDML